MLSCLLIDTKRGEREEILQLLHSEAAYLSEDLWNMETAEQTSQLSRMMEREFDMACLDVTVKEMLFWTEEFRRTHERTFLLVIADAAISPAVYCRPSIRPTGLILRQSGADQMRKVLRELMQMCIDRLHSPDSQEHFLVEERGERTIVEYSKIYYFESREKKVYVRCAAIEYGFYDTLDHLEETLPDYFIRCHRSYIINRRKIERILLGQNCIELERGMTIPVSRSYRSEVKKL